MKLGHKALEARWDQEEAKWRVRLENVKTKELFEDSADALITAVGALNEWRWPQISGLKDYEGALLHSAAWDEGFKHQVCWYYGYL